MRSIAALVAATIPVLSPLGAGHPNDEFPPASAAEVGLSAAALADLAALVHGFVEDERVVGAELLVVKDRRTVLHETFGTRDREEGAALEHNAIFNVRSMTKPVVGTLAQMLVDEGLLELDAPAASILPEFDRDLAREITVAHLLTHRSGLNWTACAEADSLDALATCAARLGPTQFFPGTSFLYSNTGSNVLAAALAEVAGRDLGPLLDERVLRPLRMGDTFALSDPDDPRLTRCVSRYETADDARLVRAWSPADGPQLRFLQGAHGLGSTVTDFARLLALWMDDGERDGVRLLSRAAVRRGLRPASLTQLPTTFPGRRVYYGQHWKVWLGRESVEPELFGHSGSDGTYAWAWPRRDLMVLYFTQTQDSPTGIELEAEIDRLLLAADRPAVSDALRPYVGTYWNEQKRMVRTVFVDDEQRLCLDVVGTGVFALDATDDPLRWEIPGRPEFAVRFERDPTGAIATLIPPPSTGEEPAGRLAPDPDLPSVADLMSLRLGADGERAPARLRIFRLRGTITVNGGDEIEDVLFSDGDRRSREELHRSKRGPDVTICNGPRVCTVSSRGRRRLLSGARREATLLERMAVVVGDWRRFYEHVEVLARSERDGRPAYVVRAQASEAPAVHYVVDAATGRALERHTSLELPFGSMGKSTSYADYREVDGVFLPFLWEGRFASDSLGTFRAQYTEIETNLEGGADLFEIDAPLER